MLITDCLQFLSISSLGVKRVLMIKPSTSFVNASTITFPSIWVWPGIQQSLILRPCEDAIYNWFFTSIAIGCFGLVAVMA